MEKVSRQLVSEEADVTREPPIAATLTKREKLERWSALLAADSNRILRTFEPTEYVNLAERNGMRCEGTALSVAHSDPVLRDAGLHDDTFGTGKRFFGLTDDELHCIVCYCHHGRAVRAGLIANVIRTFTPRPPQPSLITRAWRLFGLRSGVA